MTVTYTAEVATCRGFGCFLKLLLRWRASIYKLVYIDLLLFLFFYYSLSVVYRLVLNDHQKDFFEQVVLYCGEHTSQIPLSFVLGFYVTIVMNRWWQQYTSIPWPDSIAVFVSATIHGNDERGRLMRRTIIRYVCFCLTLVLSNISPRVKKRFPTLEHFVDAGLLLESELSIVLSLNDKFPKPSKHWLPIVWAASIVTRARKEGRIRDDFAVKTLIDELNKFRGTCGSLINYDTISIPLVYTQVVTLATYTYFLTSVISSQWIQKKPNATIDLYFPFFTTLQFFFYMGWLKVAETLINPFGEDDDDFEVNWLIDRNLQVGYLIVDEMHHEHPELIRDQYWDEIFPTELPYTAAAEPFREEHPEPSTANIQLSAAQQELQPSSVRIEDMAPDFGNHKFSKDFADDAASGIHFNADGKLSRSGSRIVHRERSISERSNLGSTASNLGGSLPRVNSVTSVLKKLFGKEDKPDGTVFSASRMAYSGSNNSLTGKMTGGIPTRIGVIEEVDEQLTTTSTRYEPRTHVKNIFPQGPPPPSAPMNVPLTNTGLSKGHFFAASVPIRDTSTPGSSNFDRVASRSADEKCFFPEDIYSLDKLESEYTVDAEDEKQDASSGSSTQDGEGNDEFTKLKTEREKLRREKVLERIVRSVGGHYQATRPTSLDKERETLLLSDLVNSAVITKSEGRPGGNGDDQKV